MRSRKVLSSKDGKWNAGVATTTIREHGNHQMYFKYASKRSKWRTKPLSHPYKLSRHSPLKVGV